MNNVFGDSVRFIPKGKPTDKNNKYVYQYKKRRINNKTKFNKILIIIENNIKCVQSNFPYFYQELLDVLK